MWGLDQWLEGAARCKAKDCPPTITKVVFQEPLFLVGERNGDVSSSRRALAVASDRLFLFVFNFFPHWILQMMPHDCCWFVCRLILVPL